LPPAQGSPLRTLDKGKIIEAKIIYSKRI